MIASKLIKKVESSLKRRGRIPSFEVLGFMVYIIARKNVHLKSDPSLRTIRDEEGSDLERIRRIVKETSKEGYAHYTYAERVPKYRITV